MFFISRTSFLARWLAVASAALRLASPSIHHSHRRSCRGTISVARLAPSKRSRRFVRTTSAPSSHASRISAAPVHILVMRWSLSDGLVAARQSLTASVSSSATSRRWRSGFVFTSIALTASTQLPNDRNAEQGAAGQPQWLLSLFHASLTLQPQPCFQRSPPPLRCQRLVVRLMSVRVIPNLPVFEHLKPGFTHKYPSAFITRPAHVLISGRASCQVAAVEAVKAEPLSHPNPKPNNFCWLMREAA
jgi:hypothetical protein